jgi:metacaspase-1
MNATRNWLNTALALALAAPAALAGTMATAPTLSPTSTTAQAINPAGEEDFFKLVLPSAGTLTVRSTGTEVDTMGAILSSTGAVLASGDDNSASDLNFTVSYAVPKAGTYFVKAESYYSDETGAYGLAMNWTGVKPDDHGNTIATAKALPLVNNAGSLPGEIEKGADVDYFKIVVPIAGTLSLSTTGSTDTSGILVNSAGAALARNDNGTDKNFSMSYAAKPSTLYLAVRHASATGVGPYTVQVKLTPPPATVSKRALCVGISDYKSISDLSLCDEDANAIAAVLRSAGWQVTTLIDAQATKAGIEAAIRKLAPGGGQFMFTFSGHGTQVGNDGALCAWDCSDTGGLVASPDLNSAVTAASTTQMSFIFDSCHSGGLISRAMNSGKKARFWKHPRSGTPDPRVGAVMARQVGAGNRVVLTGSTWAQYSYELSELGHGALTYSVLKAFANTQLDTNGNRFISMEESTDFVVKTVIENVDNQTPQFYDGNAATQFDVKNF